MNTSERSKCRTTLLLELGFSKWLLYKQSEVKAQRLTPLGTACHNDAVAHHEFRYDRPPP
ncbi:hypothetical protein HMEPL2_22080 [Vreelandella aquamarina]|uniref:Uncharacterized protein n=1 Tax=Vreelandella aquamarina TaxID=77097 RepID=A0A6F8XFL0_9GAMM|nr:hypothetical protein HMEPL2_22080 [Halomonas meridiana]